MPKIDAKVVKEIDKLNQKNLKKVESGGKIEFLQKVGLVLIGKGHKEEHLALAEDGDKGTIEVKRVKGPAAGEVTVKGSRNRREMENAIGRISKKTVKHE